MVVPRRRGRRRINCTQEKEKMTQLEEEDKPCRRGVGQAVL